MRKSILVLGLFAAGFGLVEMASGQPGAQPGRGGFGGGPGVGGSSPLTLLSNPSVKKELELTEEQTAALPDAVRKALSGVLNSKQLERLNQIELQQRGTNALLDAKTQQALKLTETQVESIKGIVEDSRKEMREAFSGGGGAGGFRGNAEKLEKLRAETQDKINGVLTLDQRNSWKRMTGEPFKMERPAFGGFGGGDGKKRFEFKKKDV